MNTLRSSYDNVILIGNGFDLNLGLPTKYEDFMSSNFFADFMTSGGYLAQHLKKARKLNQWIDLENELKEFSNSIQGSLGIESVKDGLHHKDV